MPTDDNAEGGQEDKPKQRGIIMREYTVFNANQIEGVDLPPVPELTPHDTPRDLQTVTAALQAMPNPPAISWGHNQALYRPAKDVIEMPDPERFQDDLGLMETFWHELVHATGHPSRLNRPNVNHAAEVQVHERATEELVAEIAAAMLMARYGIQPEDYENAAAYTASWRKYLTDHPGHLITAAQQAQKAYDLIIAALEPEPGVIC